ncbi:hypothetical protein GCM10010299_73390 [Streptomyces tanashiensis]|nr:hypothetical protein GCM10010299_73390 [Streptomyces tanashiensis]
MRAAAKRATTATEAVLGAPVSRRWGIAELQAYGGVAAGARPATIVVPASVPAAVLPCCAPGPALACAQPLRRRLR